MQHIQSTSNLLEKIYTSILFDYIVALILHDVSNSVWHGLDKVLQGVQLDLFPCPLKKFFKIAIYFGRSFSDFIVSSKIDHRFSIGFKSGEFGGHSAIPQYFFVLKPLDGCSSSVTSSSVLHKNHFRLDFWTLSPC